VSGVKSPFRLPCLCKLIALALLTMANVRAKSNLKVCLLSPHPVFIDGFRRFLSDSGFQIVARQLEFSLAPDLRYLEVPRASIYVIDAYAQRQATAALLGNIHEHNSGAGLLVVGDNLKEADSYTLLRQGIKGILNYTEAREQLPNALRRVASGGFWVPRHVLSRFVDFILNTAQWQRRNPPAELSRREQEVLVGLREKLANKEVADRLHISERTVKFHVSNLFAKFGVRRRADLILLCCRQDGAGT
jgi:DNA-binding NarL/FixJ family response regulator